MTVIPELLFDRKKNKTPKQVIDANETYHRKIITKKHSIEASF